MRERDIERKLVNAVKDKGGLCLKLTTTTFDGIPDRLILLPGAKSTFVELKAPEKNSIFTSKANKTINGVRSKVLCGR